MSRKDYVAIAAILAKAPQGNAEEYRRAVARMLLDYFASQNKAFDASRFLNAANI